MISSFALYHFIKVLKFCFLKILDRMLNFTFGGKLNFISISEDNELVRIILVKSGRDAANCWPSLLSNEYSADPWTFNEMEKKLTLERFQKEVQQTPKASS